MTIPNATVQIVDGRLGLTPQLATNVLAVMGCSSAGTNNAVNSYAAGNPQAIANDFGQGPLVEAAAYANQRGVPVIACKVAQNAAGAAGSVTQVGTGTSALTPSGASRDSYSVLVKITQGATGPTVGTAALKVSLDGGLSFGPEVALPTSGAYVIPNTGLTLTFGAGTLVAGDTYAFACTSPVFTTTELNTALTALLADPRLWFAVHVVGVPADSSTMLGFLAAIDTALVGAQANYRFARGLMSAYSGTDAALIASALSASSKTTGIGAGFGNLLSPLNGAQMNRPVGAWVTAAKLGVVNPEVDAAQFDLGAETGVVSLVRDEEATPGLDAARYCTMRTFKGVPGFYVTNARLISDPTSDFRYFQHGRVMDIAAAVVRVAGLAQLNRPIRVNKKTGLILEQDAQNIENNVAAELRAETSEKGRCSDATAQVDRTNNILSTSQLNINYSITPLAYAKTVQQTIGFTNPALVQVVNPNG